MKEVYEKENIRDLLEMRKTEGFQHLRRGNQYENKTNIRNFVVITGCFTIATRFRCLSRRLTLQKEHRATKSRPAKNQDR
jgi:hypothetical protein